jgi:hypothetical protein
VKPLQGLARPRERRQHAYLGLQELICKMLLALDEPAPLDALEQNGNLVRVNGLQDVALVPAVFSRKSVNYALQPLPSLFGS